MTDREGWGFLDDDDAGAVNAAPTALDRAYARAFTSTDGERVLDHLVTGTLGAVTVPGSPDAALREHEGARRLVRAIENRIKRGQQI